MPVIGLMSLLYQDDIHTNFFTMLLQINGDADDVEQNNLVTADVRYTSRYYCLIYLCAEPNYYSSIIVKKCHLW